MSKKNWLNELNLIDADSSFVADVMSDLRRLSTGGATCTIDGLTYHLVPFVPEDAQYSLDYEESEYDLDIHISGLGNCAFRQIESFPLDEFVADWTATASKANVEAVLEKHDVMTDLLLVRQELRVRRAEDELSAGLEELAQERSLGFSGRKMKQVDYSRLIETEWANQFDVFQLGQIRRGLELGVDVSVYAKPEFDEYQMWEIREGLLNGLDVSHYADPKFDSEQMQKIRAGLEKGVDVSIYAKPEFSWQQMWQIQMGLGDGLDVSSYADPAIDAEQMGVMREELGGHSDQDWDDWFNELQTSLLGK